VYDDDDLALAVVLCTILLTLLVVPIVVLLPKSGPKQHTEVLPTTIIKQAALPPLAQTKLLTKKLVTLAAKKAEIYWGGTRCTAIKFDYRPLPGRIIAQAQWYTNSNDSVYLDCSITFNTDPTKVKVSFYHYCAALIHEYGHLSGHPHSTNPNNLMYPILREATIPKTCKVKVYVAGLGARL